MQQVKANLHPCKHCNETGTCTSGENGLSCVACVKYHDLKTQKTYRGLACGTCGGLGQSEPLTERINKRTKPFLAMGIVFVLLVCVVVLALIDSKSFTAFLAFAGTLIGSITTFYFSKVDTK